MQQARAALAKDDYAAAAAILARCAGALGDSPELKQAAAEVASKRAAAAKATLGKMIRDGRMLLMARQYSAAQQLLEPAAAVAAEAPEELRAQYEALRRDAAAGAARQERAAAPSDTQVAGSAAQTAVAGAAATTVLSRPQPAAQPPAAAARQPTIATSPLAAPAAAPRPAPVPVAKPPAAPAARSRVGVLAGVAAAVVVLAVAVGYFASRHKAEAPASNTYIAVNAVPWATVKAVTSLDGKTVVAVNQPTPWRIAVPAGEYKVTLAGPDGREQSAQVKTAVGAPASCVLVFEEIDVDKILSSH